MCKKHSLIGLTVAIFILGLAAALATDSVVRADFDNETVRLQKLPSSTEISALPTKSEQPDTILYDNSIAGGYVITQNVWTAVKFTPTAPFNMLAIYFAVWNPSNSTIQGCSLFVVPDDGTGLPDWPNRISVGYEPPPLANYTWIQLDLDGPMYFPAGQDFHIAYGPAPCGPYPTGGWWSIFDNNGTTTYRTHHSPDNGQSWDNLTVADAFIRVGGWYSAVPSTPSYSIPEIYADLADLLGDTLNVIGWYTNPVDSMLVDFYWDWLCEEPIPPHTKAKVLGELPDSAYCGGYVRLRAIVDMHVSADLLDTLVLLDLISYEILINGSCDGNGTFFRSVPEDGGFYEQLEKLNGCDSCKFAILVSAGEKNRHWQKVKKMYEHKVNNENYCSSNVFVMHKNGAPGAGGGVPAAQVKPCTNDSIEAVHQRIAHRVAECHKKGDTATVQKLFDEHGYSDGAVNTTDDSLLTAKLCSLQQAIIDSSSDTIPLEIYDEFIQCYGGSTAVTLRRCLKPKRGTVIRANANAGRKTRAWGTDGAPYDVYLHAKIESLETGHPYDDAVREAQERYQDWLREVVIPWKGNELNKLRNKLDQYRAHNNPDTTKVKNDIATLKADSLKEENELPQTGVVFKKVKLVKYCDAVPINVPPGWQLTLHFEDSKSCGNVKVYEWVDPPGTWRKVAHWNWNNPGSAGYKPGNNRRTRNVGSTSSGKFKVHNDDSEFTISLEATGEHRFDESLSNIAEYASASFGWNDESPLEFNLELVAPLYFCQDAGQDGFELINMPGILSPWMGVQELVVDFGEMGENEYWSDMEIWLDVLEVIEPGTLFIWCEGAEFPEHTLFIDEPGEYIAHLGNMLFDILPPGKSATFYPLVTFYANVSLTFDCWALRTRFSPGVCTLSVADAWGVPGSSNNSMDIELNNPMGVGGVEFTLAFDGTLLTADSAKTTSRSSHMDFSYISGSDSTKMIMFSMTGDSISPGSGPIATVFFSVDAGAVAGDSTLVYLKNAVMSDPIANPISVVTEDDWFSFRGMKCDINADGSINVIDIVRAVNIILGRPPLPTPYELWAADCNDDGAVNILDIVCCINRILGTPGTTGKKGHSSATVNIPEMAVRIGKTDFIPISVDADVPIAGAQFKLSYDASELTLGTPQLTKLSAGMTIASDIKNDKLTILVYSETGKIIPAGSGSIVDIPFTMAENAKGKCDLRFDEIILAESDAQPIRVETPRIALKLGQPIPKVYALLQNYPNPCYSETDIAYQLPTAGRVVLEIYNISGQLIKTLVDENQEVGYHKAYWDGKDEFGKSVSSGIYFYQIHAGEFTSIKKLVVLR
jgi:hypothetical protein